MKKRILPVAWYVSAYSTFIGTALVGKKVLHLNPLIVVVPAWLLSIIAALAVGWILVAIKPDLRFSTEAEVDGLGSSINR
jgi:hypothetical protein